MKKDVSQDEQKNHPTHTLNDSFNQAQSGMVNTQELSTKEVGVLISLCFIGFICYASYMLFFK